MCAQTLSVMQQQSGDEEAFEYNSLLRHGIFEAYSGILNGMSQPKCDQFLRPFVPVRASPRQQTISLYNVEVSGTRLVHVLRRPLTPLSAHLELPRSRCQDTYWWAHVLLHLSTMTEIGPSLLLWRCMLLSAAAELCTAQMLLSYGRTACLACGESCACCARMIAG